MATEVLMPKLSSTMDVGNITEWLKNEGDRVKVGEPIFEVMTDKIAIEVEAYVAGVLLKKFVEVGEVVPVNTVVAYIGEKGEKVDTPKAVKAAVEEVKTEVKEEVKENVVAQKSTEGVRATPAARKLARENDLDIAEIYENLQVGPRVYMKDVQAVIDHKPSVTAKSIQQDEVVVPWKGIRKMVADQMVKSVSTAPHVTMNAEVDTTALVALRKQLLANAKEGEARISFTHLIAYFSAKVLTQHTNVNARALADGIHQYSSVNLGIATALDDGLIVPVVAAADSLTIKEIASKVKDLTKRARENKLVSAELSGSTFTVTSLGATEVLNFTPIINVPEVAILGVGKSVTRLEFNSKKEIVETTKLELSLSFDHRALDGYPAALFLSDLVKVLENPGLLTLY